MAIHKCKYFDTDEMTDVSISGNHFVCRRCGAKLDDSMVHPAELAKIAEKREYLKSKQGRR